MPNAMEILLIRHAQPAWVVDGRSVLDPELTPEGHRQAALLAESARAWRRPPTALWVSDAARAQQTAAPLAAALGLEPVTFPWLTEIRLPPDWEGAPAEGMRPIFARLKKRSVEEWWDGIPGGETFRDFHHRITSNLDAALGQVGARRLADPADPLQPPRYEIGDPELRVAIVAHGGTNSVVTSELLGLPAVPWSWERLVMAHAAFTRLKATPLLDAHIFGLREHSDAGHVPWDLRSR